MRFLAIAIALLLTSPAGADELGSGGTYGLVQQTVPGYSSPSSGCYRWWDGSSTGVCMCWTGDEWHFFEYDCATYANTWAKNHYATNATGGRVIAVDSTSPGLVGGTGFFQFQAENDASAAKSMATILLDVTHVTDTAEYADMVFRAMTNGAAGTEYMRLDASAGTVYVSTDLSVKDDERIYTNGPTDTSYMVDGAGGFEVYLSNALRMNVANGILTSYGSGVGYMTTWRTAGGADNAVVGYFRAIGQDSIGADTVYSHIRTRSQDYDNTTEDGLVEHAVMSGGTLTTMFSVDGENTRTLTTADIAQTSDSKGATSTQGVLEQDVTCTTDTATLSTTGNFIPAYSRLDFVSTRVTTALGTDDGMTGYLVGVSPADTDLYGTATTITQDTTTANPSATIANPQVANDEVDITFVGGLCDSGTIHIVAHYTAYVASTSN